MSEEQSADRVLSRLQSKGLRGCPVCGGQAFGVQSPHLLTKEASSRGMHETLVVLPVICGNCGYTMLVVPEILLE